MQVVEYESRVCEAQREVQKMSVEREQREQTIRRLKQDSDDTHVSTRQLEVVSDDHPQPAPSLSSFSLPPALYIQTLQVSGSAIAALINLLDIIIIISTLYRMFWEYSRTLHRSL